MGAAAAGCVSPCQTASRMLCTISVPLSNGSSLLLVNVYFPIDNGSAARRDLIFAVLEPKALIATQQFDHFMVVGDYNIDSSRNTASCRTLMNIFDHTLTPINVKFEDVRVQLHI